MAYSKKQVWNSDHCRIAKCSSSGFALRGRTGAPLIAQFLYDSINSGTAPIYSLMVGVPDGADLETYKHFTTVYYPSPTDYFTPGKSFLLLRHHGQISHAKPIISAFWNEFDRITEDENYFHKFGTWKMKPGYEIVVGPPVSIRRAFRWIDIRHGSALSKGSILDPNPGKLEPFQWQMAIVQKTMDLKRQSKQPFTAFRTKEIQSPSQSSLVEKRLELGLIREGVPVCRHINKISIQDHWRMPDISIPKMRTIVEYDGSYWHSGTTHHESDCQKTQAFLDVGWKVIRVREHGLKRLDMKQRGLIQVMLPSHKLETSDLVDMVLDNL